MRGMHIAGVFLGLLATFAQSQVVSVTNQTFHEVIDGSDYVLLEVCVTASPPRSVPFAHSHNFPSRAPLTPSSFAPWCGVCKRVAPEFSRAAALLSGRADAFPGLVLATVDATREPDLAESLGATSYPRFLLFRDGNAEPFPTLFTAEAYVAGLARLLDVEGAGSLSPAKEFGPEAGPDVVAPWLFWRGKDAGKLDTTLVLYAPAGGEGSGCASVGADGGEGVACASGGGGGGASDAASLALEAAFHAAAGELMRDASLRFVVVRGAGVAREFELSTDAATLVLYKDHDEGRDVWAGAPSAEAIVAWLQVRNTPLVTRVFHTNLHAVRAAVPTLALLFVEEEQMEHPATAARLREALFSVAARLESEGVVERGKFTLGFTNGKKYAGWLAHYGLPPRVLPALGGERTATEATFFMEDAGGAWAREAACGPRARALTGVAGKWSVLLGAACDKADRDAVIAAVRAARAEAGETEEDMEDLAVKAADPTTFAPLTVAAIDLPLEAVEAWLRDLMAGKARTSSEAAGYAV
jgi:thiol-disulfide isomerase/thioredoxin